MLAVLEHPKPTDKRAGQARCGFHGMLRRRRAVDSLLTASLLCHLRARGLLRVPRRPSPRMAALAAGVPADVLPGFGESFGADGGATTGLGDIVVPKPPVDPTAKRSYRVIYHTAPAWKVGESTAERVLESPTRAADVGDDHYMDDYPGRIQAVVPLDEDLNEGYDTFRRMVRLELTQDQVNRARARTLKIAWDAPILGLTDLRVEDKYGALTADMLKVHSRACLERCAKAEPLVFANPDPARPPTTEEDLVGKTVADLAPKLASTDATTGTGLYNAKKSVTSVAKVIGSIETNSCLYSDDYLQSGWVKSASGTGTAPVIYADGADAPQGGGKAMRIVFNKGAGAGTSDMRQTIGSLSNPHTPYSEIWMKTNDGSTITIVFFHTNGTGTYWVMCTVTPTWTRFTLTQAAIASATDGVGILLTNALGGGTSNSADLLVWRANFNVTAASTTPGIRTTAAAKSGVILTAGGLGTTGAYLGGYVVNNTLTQTRSLLGHGDQHLSIEGSTAGWNAADNLTIYDAWGTAQGGADQLFTDQGTTAYTFNQWHRIYAGTWAENLVYAATMDAAQYPGYYLITEGDPAVARSTIIIAPAAGTESLYSAMSPGAWIIRHLTVAGTPSDALIEWTASIANYVLDCVLTSTATDYLVKATNGNTTIIEDCVGTQSDSATSYGIYAPGVVVVRRCKLTGPGPTVTSYALYSLYSVIVESSAISGWMGGGPAWTGFDNYGPVILEHSVYYNIGTGGAVHCSSGAVDKVEALNCIFHTCTTVFATRYPVMPEISSLRRGYRLRLRNNHYYTYTNFAKDTGSTSQTYTRAVFEAFSGVDASGETDGTDPLLTSPATGDFTLQAGSPCINAGIGAGVDKDIDGVTTLAPAHPSVGCDFSRDAAGPVCTGTWSVARTAQQNAITADLSGLTLTRADRVLFFVRAGASPTTADYTYLAAVARPTDASAVIRNIQDFSRLEDGVTYYIKLAAENEDGFTVHADEKTVTAAGYLQLA